MEINEKRKLVDDEHLRLLALAHLIDGFITIAFSCLFIIHFAFMAFVAGNVEAFAEGAVHMQGAPPPLEFFRIFTYVLGALILIGIMYGIGKILSSKFIKERKHRLFSYIIAIPGFVFIPYGTILGIATIIVLGRETVKRQYEVNQL